MAFTCLMLDAFCLSQCAYAKTLKYQSILHKCLIFAAKIVITNVEYCYVKAINYVVCRFYGIANSAFNFYPD